jgi:hypothetical protein
MQELGSAINESLSDSDRIAGAIGEIKRAGYDVFLVLEATIGFNKREDAGGEAEEEASAAGAKGIPFLPQLKAWLIAPFCGYPANGAAVARMLRCRSDIFAMCNFPDSVPPGCLNT